MLCAVLQYPAKVVATIILLHRSKQPSSIMHLFKKLQFAFLCLVILSPIKVSAEISVPDFSFIGKEIARFNIEPTFTKIDISFSDSTSFDTYLDNLDIQVNEIKGKEYESSDPGSLYNSSFGTGLSSIFVGNKAYRNYIAKRYLQKDYLGVINAYLEYNEKFKGGKYEDEVNFLYASALLNTGSIDKGLQILKEIAKRDSDDFKSYAQDLIFSYYDKLGSINEILEFGRDISTFTQYGLFVYTKTLYQKNNYTEVLNVLAQNNDYLENNPDIKEYEIASRYFLGQMDKLAEIEPFSETSRYFITDALIKTGNYKNAREILNSFAPDDRYYDYFSFKIYLLNNNLEKASSHLEKINNPNDKLNLFFSYISENFPRIRSEVLNMFQFKSPTNRDYLNYYKGLFFLQNKNYREAAKEFEKVVFQRNLVTNSYFYKGLCYSGWDNSRAKHFFLRYLNTGKDSEKLNISRFMLAQFYFFEKKYTQMKMLLEQCSIDPCRSLEAEILLEQSDFKNALKTVAGINSDKANFIKASAHYNMKNYKEALTYLDKITNPYPGKNLLKMLTYYKLGEFDKGLSIFEENKNNNEFLDRTIRQLFLSNQYLLVTNIVNDIENPDPSHLLIKAKALYSMKEYDKAEVIYRNFLSKNMFIYDSIEGLISIHKARGVTRKFLENGFNWLNEYNFDKESDIALDFSRTAFNSKHTDLGIKYINYFFSNYPNAPNAKEAYKIRADFFYEQKKFRECVMDVNSAIERFGESGDLLLQKAKCIRNTATEDALAIYRQLKDSKQYGNVAKRNIILFSDNVTELEKISLEFKETDFPLYLKGIEKILNRTDIKNLKKKEDYIYQLANSGLKEFVPAGSYFIAALDYNNKKYNEAATKLMRVYYLHKDSKYATKALKLAAKAFEKSGDKANVEKVKKILENKEE